ncbi:MAG: hypothetical protein V1679_02815 [Candidatus Peregrinibacteria bacterium]
MSVKELFPPIDKPDETRANETPANILREIRAKEGGLLQKPREERLQFLKYTLIDLRNELKMPHMELRNLDDINRAVNIIRGKLYDAGFDIDDIPKCLFSKFTRK